MKNFVELLIKNIVTKPENVEISEIDKDSHLEIQIKVDPEDTGRVIGKNGRIISSIRVVCSAASINIDKRVNVIVQSDAN